MNGATWRLPGETPLTIVFTDMSDRAKRHRNESEEEERLMGEALHASIVSKQLSHLRRRLPTT
jgi:hypothetical protein